MSRWYHGANCQRAGVCRLHWYDLLGDVYEDMAIYVHLENMEAMELLYKHKCNAFFYAVSYLCVGSDIF